MATLDELVVRIKADASQLERELKKVQGTVQQSSSKIGGALGALKGQFAALVPALGVAALVSFGKSAIDAAGRMNDLAQQIGFSASTLSALERPLAASGASLEQFAASINLMNANIGEAVQNLDGPAAQAFQRLGLSIEDLKRLSPEEQFNQIARALAQVGTQFEQTELGRAIFGRGFAAMIPVIKETNGELDRLREELSQETIDRIDQFGDALQGAGIKAKNAFLEAFAAILKAIDAASEFVDNHAPPTNAYAMAKVGITPQEAERQNAIAKYTAEAKAKGFVTEATKGTIIESSPYGPAYQPVKAAATTKTASDSQKRYNDLMAEGKRLTEQNRTAYESYTDRVAKAQQLLKAGAIDQITYQRELAAAQQEMASASEDAMNKAGDAAIVNARIIKDYVGDALESAIFDFKNFGNAASNILNSVARQLMRQHVINPLSNSISNGIGNLFGGGGGSNLPWLQSSGGGGGFGDIFSSIGSFLGFADGGDPPVGVPSIVGERGPEIFVPRTAGTIVPNHAMGGQNITVQNYWSIAGGVTKQELAALIPVIEARSRASVFEAIERGGRESRLVNRKN